MRVIVFLLAALAFPASASLLIDASGEDATVGTAVVSDEPFVVGWWFKRSAQTSGSFHFGINTAGTTDNYFAGFFDSSDQLVCRTRPTSSADAITTDTITDTDTWHFALCTFASDSSRFAELDDGGAVENTNNVTPSGMDATTIGNLTSSTTLDADSRIAYAFVASTTLTAQQEADLASGDCPTTVIDAGDQVSLWTFTDSGDLGADSWGANDLTVNGATHDADDPTIGACDPIAPLSYYRSLLNQ